jgi:anaerobic magnesium-protoporphyrin IX monomethyl ester cyclase
MYRQIDSVLLITPSLLLYPKYDYLRVGAPIGCASIASTLRQNLGVTVKFIDAATEGFKNRVNVDNGLWKVGLSENELAGRIEEISPKIVAVSNIHTRDQSCALEICQVAKRVDSEITVVMGGNNPSGNYEKILQNKCVDFIITGEGEISFLNLILYLKGELDFHSLHGVAKKYGSDVVVSSPKMAIANLEDLPNPEWQIFNKELYGEEVFHTGIFRGNSAIDFFTSRGCPGNCDYCCSPLMWSKKFRCLSLEKIVQQLVELKSLGYDEIILHDDNILVNEERAKSIFRTLNEMGFFWTIMGGMDRSRVTLGLLDSIIENGCSRVHYSVESYNLDILRKHHKFLKYPVTKLNETPSHVQRLADGGVEVFCDFMIGFPEETISDIHLTIDYAKRLKDLGMSFAEFSCVTPFPGTDLYKRCLEQGYITNTEKYEDYTLTKGNLTTENFTADQITELRIKALSDVNGPEIFRETRERLHRPRIKPTQTKNKTKPSIESQHPNTLR